MGPDPRALLLTLSADAKRYISPRVANENCVRRGKIMSQTIAGGCACGAIRYETDATPIAMFNCHCRDCQRASGSGYAAILVVPKATVRVQGQPRYYKTVGNAGQASTADFVRSVEAR